MSEIQVSRTERYSFLDEKTAWSDVIATYEQVFAWVLAGKRMALYVDRWKKPWPVSIGEHDGLLHARCPGASAFVNPPLVPR